MASPTLDFSRWPVVIVRAPSGPVSDAEIARAFEELHSTLARTSGPYVNVMDLTEAQGLDSRQRREQAVLINNVHDRHPGRCVGTGLVFTSALMRRMLSAVLWLRTPRYDTRVFPTVPRAIAWAQTQVGPGSRTVGD